MVENTQQMTLDGMQDMNIGVRVITCECGCGLTFRQPAVGRARKYLDDSHKSAAYRKAKANKQNKPLIGDTVKELLDYLDTVFEVSTSLEWLSDYEREALAELHASDNREALRLGLNELFMRYCA